MQIGKGCSGWSISAGEAPPMEMCKRGRRTNRHRSQGDRQKEVRNLLSSTYGNVHINKRDSPEIAFIQQGTQT